MDIDARRNQFDRATKERISEVARVANDLQLQEPHLTRTEALKIAERLVPHPR